MSPLRVCLIVPDFPAATGEQRRHGTATLAEMLARAWLLLGAEVHVVWYGPRWKLGDAPPIVPVQLHRVRIPQEGRVPGLAMVLGSLVIDRAVARLDRQLHFKVITAFNDEGYLLASVRRLKHRIHLRVSTSLAQSLGYQSAALTWQERVSARLSRWTLHASRNLVTNSTAQAEAMRAELRPGQVAHVVPLGIDDPGVRQLQASSGAFCVGYLGMLTRRKGIDTFLEAVALAAERRVELQALIAGWDRGGVQGFPTWERYAREALRIPERTLSFLGQVPDTGMAAFWDRIDLLAVPSRWESFGLVVIEAMARGVPVVVTDGGALSEVVGAAGLVIPAEDSEALLETMQSLASAPQRLATLSTAGRARYEAEYSLEAFARRLARHHGVSHDG